MSNNRLQVTQVENRSPPPAVMSKNARRQELQATMERMWLENPQTFDPKRNSVQRKRVMNTLKAIKEHLNLKGKRIADLGCGGGEISRLLRDEGGQIDAIDVAAQALEKLKCENMERIKAIQDCLPFTRLDDNAYDLVICLEVAGYLQPKEYRMLFAELSRLVNKDGYTGCSTSLDINSDDALARFAALAETEFEIDQWVLRYDLLWIKLCAFFETPKNYIKARNNEFERNKELQKRKSLSRLWYKINTTKAMILLWKLVQMGFTPLASYFRQSDSAVEYLEKITKFFWDESGVSHALFIGKRRPLSYPLPAQERPAEMKHKRQVWE